MQNEVNPVIYAYPNSTTAKILDKLILDLEQFFDIKSEDSLATNDDYKLSDFDWDAIAQHGNKINDLNNSLSHFIKFIKPYEGRFYRNNKYLERSVKFYDEREWRYVPSKRFFEHTSIKDSYKSDFYIDPIKRRYINMKLASHAKLNYKASDIRFIIVQFEHEIPGMIKEIEEIFGDTTPSNDLKLLGTRLISLEQILEDL